MYKNTIKILKKIRLKIYQIIIFIPSLLLLLFLNISFKTFFKNYKKIISLRISKNYFGHLSIEPAILSSYSSKNDIFPLVSFKKGKGINNKTLEKIASNSFVIRNDILNKVLENIYNNSFENIRLKINFYYSPLLHKKLLTREITYVHLLDTNKNFKWRETAQKLIYRKKGTEFKLVIALRTEHFNKKIKNVAPQPWRDASASDIAYLAKVCAKIIDQRQIYLMFNPQNNELLNNEGLISSNINLIDETKVDILELLNSNSLLINNGNGIGAAAMAIGIKTLYINHTFWHFWHTSHANALCLPSQFIDSKSNEKSNLEKTVSLAFSPRNCIPLNFYEHYYPYGISINKIEDIEEKILLNSILQILKRRDDEKKYKENLMGCEFEYSNKKEKDFWEKYIIHLPPILRESHKLIKLNISNAFLDGF